MKMLIGAIGVLVLLVASLDATLAAIVPTVMATTMGFWTANNTAVTPDLKYHLFLDGIYPSSKDRIYKLGNDGLTVCLHFTSHEMPTREKVAVCHPITHIPSIDNSTIDAGYFVVPSSLNESHANICALAKFHAVYDYGGGERIGTELHMDMNKMIYDDVFAVDACVGDDHHLREGTKDFDFCVSMLN
jgi:hypothetical protein